MSHEPAQNRTETASYAQEAPVVIHELQAARETKWAAAIYRDAATRWGTGILDSADAMTEYELIARTLTALAAEETFEATSALRQELAQAQAEITKEREDFGRALSLVRHTERQRDEASAREVSLRKAIMELADELRTSNPICSRKVSALAAEPTPAAEPHAEDGAEEPDEPCPDCGDDPSNPTLHANGCPRIGSPVQCGPPWLPIPAPVADPDDTKDGQR